MWRVFFWFFLLCANSINTVGIVWFCVQETVRRNQFVGSFDKTGSSPERVVLKMKLWKKVRKKGLARPCGGVIICRKQSPAEHVSLKVFFIAVFSLLIVSLWTLYNCAPYRFSHLVEWKPPSSAGKRKSSLFSNVVLQSLPKKKNREEKPPRGFLPGELSINIKTLYLHSRILWCLTDASSSSYSGSRGITQAE